MRPVFRTLSFWLCCAGATVDVGMAAFCRRLGALEWSRWFLLCGACFAVGAAAHWYLDRKMTPRGK
ncbi:MAG: hypothetical protein ACREMO_08630 [Gemmatimonadales bacterium]